MNVAQRMIEDGFVTQENTKLLTDVADVLERTYPQIHANVYHSGGGNFGILVTKQDGTTVLWGDCDGFWAADVNDADDDFVDSILTETPFTNVAIEEVVEIIHAHA